MRCRRTCSAKSTKALDHAELEGVGAVVIAGNNKVFSGGFDLKVLTGGGQAAIEMLAGGFELAARILAFPKPVVMACTGHSIAMGSFLMLSGDYLIGSPSHRIQANEVCDRADDARVLRWRFCGTG